MDPIAFVARVRDHYVDQFAAFANGQRQSCSQGASEVKFQLSDHSEVFRRLYCVDFIKNDGEVQAIEFQPENILTFDEISGSFGSSSLSIQDLRWDDVVIYHNAPTLPQDKVGEWFRRWFDPDDERHVQHAPLSDVIHSLLIEPASVSIDFGTAAPDAFWDMLELLEGAGATTIRVSSSRTEALL
jgi:hypothetical protein